MYHACTTELSTLDRVLSSFLRQVGISDLDALVSFRLAPLTCRRDMAMLGVIHRTILGQGPPEFSRYFRLDPTQLRRSERLCKHPRQIVASFPGKNLEIFRRSILGLCRIYNMLPEHVAKCDSVEEFQHELQELLKQFAVGNHPCWQSLFSPRIPYATHPLR